MEDIELAKNDDVYSRFLIVPTRTDRLGKSSIASATLGGFGGFFDRSFRVHDFELGRRNCQKFLRTHFGIPVSAIEDNEVFKGKWSKEAIKRFGFKKEVNDKIDYFIPIIPDMDVAGWNEITNKTVASTVVEKKPFPVYNWKKNIPMLRKRIWQRIWLIARYTIRHRIRITVHKSNFWRNLLRGCIAIIVLILLLPFLLVAAIPLYFMMRNYILNGIMRTIRKNFEEVGVVSPKKKPG
jgi:hypothetical protein